MYEIDRRVRFFGVRAVTSGVWQGLLAALLLTGVSHHALAVEPMNMPVVVTNPPVQGSLVIIGGNARNDNLAIWNEVTRLASKRGQKKKIAVFPCASRYPEKNGNRAVEVLNSAGADAFLVPVAPSGLDVDHREAVKDADLVESVRQADGVFFIGGAQSRICEALLSEKGEHTPMLDAVWDVYRKGGVVAGTSAGAAIMSRVMFRDAGVVLSTMLNGVKMGKEIDRGLGFLDPAWFIDQHCLARGRFARSIVAMHDQKVQFGVGIDEDSALVVENGADAKVVGQRGAIVMDLSKSKTDAKEPGFNLKDVRLTYLNQGDRLNLKTLAVTPDAAKINERKIDPATPTFKPSISRALFSADILAGSALLDTMRRILEHKDGHAIGLAFDGAAATKGSTSGFEFRFYRGKDSRGWESEVQGGADYTIQNIHLDIRPIRIRGPIYDVSSVDSDDVELANGK